MKKTLLITMLSAALTAGAGVTLNNFNDVNSDNAVDVGDVNTVLGNILGGSKQYFIDTNGDGNVDVGDVNTVLNTILTTPTVTGDEADAAALLLRCYANFSVSGDGGRNGGCWVPDFDGGTSAFYRQMWNLNELTSDEAMCAWDDFGTEDLNLNISTPSTPQLAGYWLRLYKGIDFCNEYLAKYSKLDATATAEVRLLRALNYLMLLDAWGNVPITVTPGETTPPQKSRAEVFAWVESELLATLDNLDEPSPKTSRSANYGRVDRAAAWLLLARLYLNAEVYTGTARWKDAANYARLVIDSPYELVTGRSNHEVNGQNWNFSAYQRLFMGDNDRTDAARECIMPLIHDSRKTFWTSWSTSMYLIAGTFDYEMDEHPWYNTNNGLSSQCWAGLHARPQLVRQFFAEGDYADDEIPSARGYENAVTAGDDRALLNSKDRALYNTDWQNFRDGFAVAKFTNFTTDGSLSFNAQIADADVFLLRKAEAYLTLAEALTRQDGGRVTLAEAADAINALRERAGATLMRRYSLDDILDEWSREFYFEGRRRMDLIRFGRYGGETDYNWQWKGGVADGINFPEEQNIFPIPQIALTSNPNLKQNPGYDNIPTPETFALSLSTIDETVVDLLTEPVFAFSWQRPDYLNPLVTPYYTLQFSLDADFATVHTIDIGQMFIGTAVDIDPATVNSLVIEANNGEMPSGKVMVYFRCNAQHFTSSVNSNTVSRKVQVYEPFVPADKPEVKLWYLVGDCVSSNYWSNLPADVGAGPSITPLLPLPDAQYNAKDGTGLISTVIYLPQGGQFKFVDGTGIWADDCQINSNNSYCVLPDDWNTDDWNENFVVGAAGYYHISLDTSSRRVEINRYDGTPGTHSQVSMPGEYQGWQVNDSGFRLTGIGAGNLDRVNMWYAKGVKLGDTELKFAADGGLDVNWGSAAFPYGIGVQDGANITVAEGTYDVFFNDITGQYYFVSLNKETSGTGNKRPDFYVTEAEPIDFNVPDYRLFIPHFYKGVVEKSFTVTITVGEKSTTVNTNSKGYILASSFKTALSELGLMDQRVSGNYKFDLSITDSKDSPAVTSRVTFNHQYDDSRRYFINGRELTPLGDGFFTLELQEDESWVITDNDGNNYGAISRDSAGEESGHLTTRDPLPICVHDPLYVWFDAWKMTYRTGWPLEYESYIWQAGNSNGWGSPAAPLYSPYSNGKYSGYMYLNGGFTFRSKEFSWDSPNWGSDGTTNGLQEYGYEMSASEGFYRVDVNLVSMVYYLTPITTVSIIGTASGDTDLDMAFNKSTGAWECTAELTAGEFKFRANHDWEMNWGGTTGDIVTNGPQLTITEAGAYHISLSLKCDTRSTCTITKQ